jgi:hypothetical protein
MMLAVLPASAAADTICVRRSAPVCTPPMETEVQAALTRAQTNPGADTVLIGPGSYATTTEAGFSYVSVDPVTISGAGAGRTVLTSGVTKPESVLRVQVTSGPAALSTSVAGLSAIAGGLPNGRATASVTGTVTDSEFTAQSAENATVYALRIGEGSVARRISAIARGTFAVGIGVPGPAIVVDSNINATVGIEFAPGFPPAIATVQRTRVLTTRIGLDVCNAAVVAEDVAIETVEQGVSDEGSARCGGENSQFTGRNLTIVGEEGTEKGVGLDVSGNVTDPSAVLTDSVLWDLGTSIRAAPLPGRTSTLRLARLAEDTTKRDFTGAGTLFLTDEGGHVGDPRLVAPERGNLHLGPGSPAIDAGAPGPVLVGESPTDLEGNARVLDGNGDGTARRDIGAFEAPALTPAPSPPSSPPPTLTAPLLRPPPRDITPPALTALVLRRGRHPRLDLISSESATLKLTLRGLSRGCRHVSKRCKQHTLVTQAGKVRAGKNRIVLSPRMARLLKRGMSLLVAATDAAGNRSKVKTLRT